MAITPRTTRASSSHTRFGGRRGLLGFALAPILYIIALAGIAGTVLFTGYTQILRSNVEITADNNVRNQIRMATEIIAAQSAVNNALNLLVPPDVVAWNTLDAARLPRNSSGGVLTDTIAKGAAASAAVGGLASTGGIRQMDPWGRYFIMCRWEGSTGGGQTDPSMSILSAGADGNLATTCADNAPAAGSDDKMEYMTVANVLSRSANWQAQSMAGNRTGYTFGIDPDSSVLAVGVDAASVDTSKSLDIGGDGRFRGDLLVNETLGVDGATSLGSTLAVTGATTLSNTLGVTGATTLTSTLNVGGVSTLTTANIATANTGALNASGVTTLSGATTIDDTLNVTGASTLASAGITTATIGTANITTATITTAGITTGNIATANAGALTVTGASALNTFTAASGVLSGALTANSMAAATGTFTNLTVTNPINGSITGSAGSVDGGAITGIVPLNRGGTGVNASSNANLRTLLSIQTQDADLQALSDNTATGFIRRTGAGTISTSAILQSEVPAFTGAGAGSASTLGGVPVAAAGQQNFVLTGNGLWTNPATLVGVTELTEGDSGVYVDDTGTGVIRFLIDGFEQARITGVASADRSVRLTGGTAGTVPEVAAYATGGNSALRVSAIGTGSLSLRTNGVDRLTIDSTGAASMGGTLTSTGGFIGNLTGNASTATILQTARNFSLTGDATATAVSFNGSAAVALATTVARLQGRNLSSAAPNTDDAIVWSGTQWEPANLSTTLDGQTINNVDIKLKDGAVATPALAFVNDVDSGLYRVTGTDNNLAFALGGVQRVYWGTDAFHFNSATDITPLSVGRGVSRVDEVFKLGIADGSTNIAYSNDEAQSYINFRMINTDTESGGGASASDNVPFRIFSNVNGGRVGINTGGAPAAALHIVSTFPVEQIRISNNETNNTNKVSQITSGHYLNAEEPFQLIGSDSTAATNVLYLGGGFSNSNAATAISFRTAANNATTVGTERMSINSAGTVGVVGNMTVGGNLTVTGTVTGSGGTSAGGSNTQVQFNNSGVLAGSAGLVWDNTNRTLTVSRAAGAGSGIVLNVSDGSRNIFINPHNTAGAWNPLGQTGDQMLLYTGGAIDTGALVIGPHSAGNKGIRIAADGSVGIATPSPGRGLHITGDTAAKSRIRLTRTGAGAGEAEFATVDNMAVIGAPSGIAFYSGAFGSETEKMRMDASGNFGIGITPTQKLDVNGSVLSRGQILMMDANGANSKTAGLQSWDDFFYLSRWNAAASAWEGHVLNVNLTNGNTSISGNLTVSGTITGTGGTTAAGSDTHVQFNNSGVLGGLANLTFNKSASVPSLGVIGSSTAEVRLQGAGGAYRLHVDNGSNLFRIFDNGGTSRLSINAAGAVGVTNDLTVGGTTTTTGVATSDYLIMTNADPYLRTNANNKHLVVSGGSGWTSTAATAVFYGVSHATQAGNILFSGADGAARTATFANLHVAMNNNLNVVGAYQGNGKEIFNTADGYLRINQPNAFANGIWINNSNFLGAGGVFALGSNGSTTTSRIVMTGGTFNGTNVINLDGATGNIYAAGTATIGGNTAIGGGGNIMTGTTFRTKITSADSRVLALQGAGAAGNASMWWGNATGSQFAIDSINGGGGQFWTSNNGGAWNLRMTIAENGTVTIPGNLTVGGTITGSVAINFPNNSWVTSADGNARFYFATNGVTYIRGTGLEFRNGSDTPIMSWNNGTGRMSTNYGMTVAGNDITISGGSPRIQLQDTDVGGTRYVYNDGANIGFLNNTGNWSAYVNDSNQFFAYIYYDLNNTGYYVDPASVSVLNDLRATIMYDLNNTGYYVDPASTSVLNVVNVNGALNTSEWVRVQNSNGIYWQAYGGGWNMSDTTFLRAYGNKYVLAAGYYHTSDARLKHDIRPFRAAGLEVVEGLRAVHFKWNADNREELGVIAQETEKVLPEAVTTDGKGIKQVQYDKLVLPVIEAVKELHAMVKDLVAKVAELISWKDATDKRIQQLEDRLNKVEAEKAELARENAALKDGIDARLKALEAKK